MKLTPFSTLLICAFLIAYASLFPCTGWRLPQEGIFAWCAPRQLGHISKSDFLVNIIAYIPLGYLAQRLFASGSGGLRFLPWTVLLGAGFSFTMESLQTALPARNASVVDLFTNGIGTACGALAAMLWQGSTAQHGMVRRWREKHLLPGELAVAGAGVLSLWALSQWSPFVPSFDLGGLKNALKPLWRTAHDLSRFDLPHAATYFFYLAGLAALAHGSFARRPLPSFALFASVVLCAKIFILGRVISLEALAGLLGALLLSSPGAVLGERCRNWCGILLLLTGFAVHELRGVAGEAAAATAFNWVPFRGQMAFELNGIGSILEGIWPFAALSLLFLRATGVRRAPIWSGGATVFLFVFVLERFQLLIPGRHPDITQPLLALAGWVVPLLYVSGGKPEGSAQ